MKSEISKTEELSKQRIFLFGAGLHAQTCIDALEQQGKYELVGIIDSQKEIGSLVDGYKILGRIESLLDLMTEYSIRSGFIGIGTNWIRKKVVQDICNLSPDFEFVNIIHPSSVFGKNVQLGKGIFVGAQSFISSSCYLGDFCLLHQKSHLGLQNCLTDYSSISLGSLTGGKVTIGECTALTLRVTVSDRIKIGAHSVIGSGSLVLEDIPSHVVVYGHPAKVIRSRSENESYLKSD